MYVKPFFGYMYSKLIAVQNLARNRPVTTFRTHQSSLRWSYPHFSLSTITHCPTMKLCFHRFYASPGTIDTTTRALRGLLQSTPDCVLPMGRSQDVGHRPLHRCSGVRHASEIIFEIEGPVQNHPDHTW